MLASFRVRQDDTYVQVVIRRQWVDLGDEGDQHPGITTEMAEAPDNRSASMAAEDSGRQVRALARDIQRCEELERVLDGTASGCRTVVNYQGGDRLGRWYVPEPWAGHLGS